MRRIWVSAAAVAASVSVAGWMAASSAEDKKPGAALPPPSLFDDSPNQVRAVDAPAGVPSSAVVQAKPAASASVKAEASLPPPENFEAERTPKVVWWKPWTWFSGRANRAAQPAEAAAPAPKTAAAATPSAATAAPEGASERAGFAFDSPERRIRSGMGGCVKTGMWEPNGKTDECGNPVAKAPASHAEALTQAAAVPDRSVPATAAAPAPAATPAAATAATNVKPEPVEVSALKPEPDDHRKPLSEKDTFESVRVESGSARDGAELSSASIAAARAGKAPATPGADGAGGATAAHQSADPAKGAASHAQSGTPKAEGGAPHDAKVAASGKKRLVEDKPLSMSAEALFGFKSSKLLYGGKKQLDEFAGKLKDGDYQSVRVVGHTDRVGTAARNKKLSMRRAAAVKEYLVSKGIPAGRIAIDGRGAEQPVTEPRQCEGLPMTARRSCMSPDRRVEIVVTRAFARKKPEAQPAAGEPRS